LSTTNKLRKVRLGRLQFNQMFYCWCW